MTESHETHQRQEAQEALHGSAQLTRADLASLTPAEIDQAHRDGRLDALIYGTTPNHEKDDDQ